MVGGVAIEPAMAAKHGSAAELPGAVPRCDIAGWLERFDVFFFPSTCEGSAGSVMEALASGLPVLTTPNSGSVIRDGQEGFIVPPGDIGAMTSRLRELLASPGLREAMASAARKRAEEFSLDWYGSQLARVMSASG